jgi:hypothetical protein
VDVLGQHGAGPDVRERPENGAIADLALGHDHAEAEMDTVSQRRITQQCRPVELAAPADRRAAEQLYVRTDLGVGADRDVLLDVGGCGITERHSRAHPLLDQRLARTLFQVRHVLS